MSEGIYFSADGNFFQDINGFLDIKDRISSRSYSTFSNFFDIFEWNFYYDKLSNEIYELHKKIFKREPNQFTLDFIVDMINFFDHYEALKVHEDGIYRKKDEFILHDDLKQYALSLRNYLKDQSDNNAIEVINSTEQNFLNIYADPAKYLGLFTMLRGDIYKNVFELYDLDIQSRTINYIDDFIDNKYDDLDAEIMYDLSIYKENFLGMFDINQHLKSDNNKSITTFFYLLGLKSVLDNENRLEYAIENSKFFLKETHKRLLRIKKRKDFYSYVLRNVYDLDLNERI